MTSFIPQPVHDADWWGSINLWNPLGMDDKFGDVEIEEITDDSWVAIGNFIDEEYAPAEGYRVFFPTSTDCLLWVRWYLLPFECDNEEHNKTGKEVQLFGKSKEIAYRIDQAPDGTNSEKLIADIKEEITHALVNGGFDLYTLMSGQEYLNDLKEFLEKDQQE